MRTDRNKALYPFTPLPLQQYFFTIVTPTIICTIHKQGSDIKLMLSSIGNENHWYVM